MLELRMQRVGPYEMNCYLVVNTEVNAGILFDPGDDAKKILSWIGSIEIGHILLTHGHRDHVGALDDVCAALDMSFGMHAADAERFDLSPGYSLADGDVLKLGEDGLQAVHIPGHTPGSVALMLMDSHSPPRVVVGDVIFPGGPGHSASPEALALSLDSLARTVFTWPDETELHPGHGDVATVGAERAAFEAFRAKDLPADLHGDVTWA